MTYTHIYIWLSAHWLAPACTQEVLMCYRISGSDAEPPPVVSENFHSLLHSGFAEKYGSTYIQYLTPFLKRCGQF